LANPETFNSFFGVWTKPFLTIMTIIIGMGSFVAAIIEMLRAPSMQISVWIWEARMISKYGLDWEYKEPWERL
jgi:hypothetical protein